MQVRLDVRVALSRALMVAVVVISVVKLFVASDRLPWVCLLMLSIACLQTIPAHERRSHRGGPAPAHRRAPLPPL